MGARVSFLTHAPTTATDAAAFPSGDRLGERGRTWAARGRGRLDGADRVRCGPEPACVETCEVLDLPARPEPALAGWDVGEWAGRRLDEIALAHPLDLAAWLAEPDAAPHGGESLTDLVTRVRTWLSGAPDGHTAVVCEPAVARAAVVVVLAAPLAAFWRLDSGPMTLTDLRGGPDRWVVRSASAPVADGPRRAPDVARSTLRRRH